jgi:hypothetical protein
MKRLWVAGGFVLVLGLMAAPVISIAQDYGKDEVKKQVEEKKAEGEQAIDHEAEMKMWETAATPGPQHERFKSLVGTWKAEVKHFHGPEPEVTNGTSTYVLLMGGRFIQEDFKGEMMGKPFEGRGITGYDNNTKKYQGVWIDTMGTAITLMEGQHDEATKTTTMSGEMSTPMGAPIKMRGTEKQVDPNTRLFEMYMTGPDGTEMKTMEITYTRA